MKSENISFVDILLKYSKIISIGLILFAIAGLAAIKMNARMETDLDEYMPQEHPAFIFSNQAEKWFKIKDGIIIAIENQQGIYQPETLNKIKKLTKELQSQKEIKRKDVTSLYTADNIVGTANGLDVKAFYKSVPQTKDDLQILRRNVRANDMVYGRLVSHNEQITLIIAEIDDGVFTQEFYKRIISITKKYSGPEKIYVSGRPIVEGTMAYLGPKDMIIMVPIVISIITVVLLLLLKSISGTILTLSVVVFSTIYAFGLMTAFKVPVYSVSTIMPVMLIAIGVADGIHLYNFIYFYIAQHPKAQKYEAVREMVLQMWKPVVMTSVTTAIGFISLLTSEVYPIKYFGLFTAFGVMAAMVFSLVLIPAGMLVFELPKLKRINNTNNTPSRFASIFANGLIKYKYVTVFITTSLIILSGWGISKVWINSSFLDKFEKNSDIVLTDQFINKHFGGTSTINVILDAKKKDTFKEPAVLRAMDDMQKSVNNSLQIVGNSFSLADYIRRMNKVMNADNEKFNSIPDNKNLIAQYLLLYEMSGDPENLKKVVNYDYNKANLVFQIKSDNSIAMNQTIAAIDKHKPVLQKWGVSIKFAGSGYKGLVFTDLIFEGQIKSIFISILIIILLLVLMFQSIAAGLIGAIPIAITAILSFGVMGLFNIPLSTTTALLSSIAIGIGIDYAIHAMENYKIKLKTNPNKWEAGEKTIQHSGRAILYNAFVVIAGFLVLLFSVFPPNRELGALVSFNMFTSFVLTMTIMILLMYRFNLFAKKIVSKNNN